MALVAVGYMQKQIAMGNAASDLSGESDRTLYRRICF
jgi:hypothetical protein